MGRSTTFIFDRFFACVFAVARKNLRFLLHAPELSPSFLQINIPGPLQQEHHSVLAVSVDRVLLTVSVRGAFRTLNTTRRIASPSNEIHIS